MPLSVGQGMGSYFLHFSLASKTSGTLGIPWSPNSTPVLKVPGPPPNTSASGSPMTLRCSPRAASQKGCLGVTTVRSSIVAPEASERRVNQALLAASTMPSRNGGPSHFPRASL